MIFIIFKKILYGNLTGWIKKYFLKIEYSIERAGEIAELLSKESPMF